MSHRIIPFACDVIYMIFRWRWFHDSKRCLVDSWASTIYRHALSLESRWMHHSSLQFPESGRASLFLSCTALPPPSELPTFLAFLIGFLVFSIFPIGEINTFQSSSIIEFRFLGYPLMMHRLYSRKENCLKTWVLWWMEGETITHFDQRWQRLSLQVRQLCTESHQVAWYRIGQPNADNSS